MKCVICKVGKTAPGHTDVVFNVRGKTLVIRDVPAEVCDSCGEGYFNHDISLKLQAIADDAEDRGVELQVIRWPEQDKQADPPNEEEPSTPLAELKQAQVRRASGE
jgi:YgiT-type zinc finger domain-containing protein